MAAAETSASRATGIEPLGLAIDLRGEEALFLRNADRVFGFCLSRLGRREDAEDAVQTTFLHAVRSLRRGIVPLVESAWLLGIARNVCAERWESSGRRSRIEAACDPAELERASAALPARYEELIGLDEALARLPEQQRRAVLLRDWRGLSYDEVAAQMGVSHAAVETLIFRGRRTLAAQLREGAQATRRRLASLGNLGSLVTAAKAAFTGGAAATKIAAAVTTVVAVSGVGLAVGGSSPRGGDSEPQIRAQIPAPDPAPPVVRPDRITAVGPPTAVTPSSTDTRASTPKAVAKPATRLRGSEPLRPPRAAKPAGTVPAPSAPPASSPPAKGPAEKAVDAVLPQAAKQPVEQVVGAVLPPSVQTPVESVVDAVLPPAVQEPIESTVDSVEAAVPPVVPQAVETVVESLPVQPAEVVADLTDPLPLLP